ncbi:MAG: hypothetical protein ACE5I5_01285, partial [Candidatus Heimdallarchaeota archaeon]
MHYQQSHQNIGVQDRPQNVIPRGWPQTIPRKYQHDETDGRRKASQRSPPFLLHDHSDSRA